MEDKEGDKMREKIIRSYRTEHKRGKIVSISINDRRFTSKKSIELIELGTLLGKIFYSEEIERWINKRPWNK